MRWLVLAAFALGLGVIAAAVLLKRPPPPAVLPAPAPAPCADRERAPPPLLPALSAAPLVLVAGEGVAVQVDGASAGNELPPGAHLVTATAPGAASARVQLKVEPFLPVLLDVRVAAGAVTVLPLGARCASCALAETDVDLRYRPGVAAPLASVAAPLATGDWLTAAKGLRAVAPAEREAPEVRRLVAALHALSGRPTLAREQLRALPKSDPAHAALKAFDRHAAAAPQRQADTALARWNATTERYQRLTDAFVGDASETVMALTMRFDALTTRFVKAHSEADRFEQEGALDDATAALTGFVTTLRGSRPHDCAWQARVTRSF